MSIFLEISPNNNRWLSSFYTNLKSTSTGWVENTLDYSSSFFFNYFIFNLFYSSNLFTDFASWTAYTNYSYTYNTSACVYLNFLFSSIYLRASLASVTYFFYFSNSSSFIIFFSINKAIYDFYSLANTFYYLTIYKLLFLSINL